MGQGERFQKEIFGDQFYCKGNTLNALLIHINTNN